MPDSSTSKITSIDGLISNIYVYYRLYFDILYYSNILKLVFNGYAVS